MISLTDYERLAAANGLDYDRGSPSSARAALAIVHQLPATENLGGHREIFGGSCSSASVNTISIVLGVRLDPLGQ